MSLVVHDPVSRKGLFHKSQEERNKVTHSPPFKGCFFPMLDGPRNKTTLHSRAVLGRIIAQATVISSQLCNAQKPGYYRLEERPGASTHSRIRAWLSQASVGQQQEQDAQTMLHGQGGRAETLHPSRIQLSLGLIHLLFVQR